MRDMSDGNNERKKRREVYKIYYNIEIREIEGDENRSEIEREFWEMTRNEGY